MNPDKENIEQEKLIAHSDYKISVEDLMSIVNKYMQREHGSDDIDFVEQMGGNQWLETGLATDFHKGINSSTLESRAATFGDNMKKKVKIKTFWELCVDASKDLILIILIFAGIISIVINMIMEEHERAYAWIEGFAIILAVVIVVVVTAWNDLKKEKEFQKLNEEAESGKVVTIIRDGVQDDTKKLSEVLTGDVVLLKTGMEIPSDGIVLEGYSLAIDEASMTGETKPMRKDILERCLDKKRELEKKGIEHISHHAIPSIVIMAGTKVLTGSGKMLVINVGKNSSIGKIQEIMTSGEEELTPLQLKLEKIARDIGYFGLISALLIFIVLIVIMIVKGVQDEWDHPDGGIYYAREVLDYFLISITILVVAIPEGLPLAVTLSLAFSVGKMMEDKNLVRRMQACETMGGANIICSDKTGTLTQNKMYLTTFWNGKERIIYNDKTREAVALDDFIDSGAQDKFTETIVANSVEDPLKDSGNPTELAILRYLHFTGLNVNEYRDGFVKDFQAPFSSDRKRMSTIAKGKDGKHYVFIKGASEYIMQISDRILELETNKDRKLDSDVKNDITEAIDRMANKALRTIGLAYKEVKLGSLDLENKDEQGIYDWEKDGFTIIGICGIKDIIRENVHISISKCHNAGIDVKMVTGDNLVTARAIARDINIIEESNEESALVLEGPDFLRRIGGVICENCRDKEECDCVKNEKDLSLPENKGKKVRKDTIKNQEEFDKIWRNLVVLARSRPEDKYALVIGLKERDNVVAVTGDGTNDAPALSKANVGFAMNIAGTEVAKQAADILIMDDNFTSIVQAVKWGRNIYDSIRKFLQFQLTVNVVAVVTTFVSAAVLQEAILSAVQMLWVNLIMDTLAALALATEPPTEALLERKPHGKNDYIISPLMMKHILGQAIFQIIVLLVIVFLGEHFLPDVIGGRQECPNDECLILPGRRYTKAYELFADNQSPQAVRDATGYEHILDVDNLEKYSVHYTYIFNIFVWMQLFNLINSRVIDDKMNVFSGICASSYFIIIFIIILIGQIIFITFLGPAIRVAFWGVDPLGWVICIVIGFISLIVAVILKLIPLEKILPGGGNKELDVKDLDRINTLSIRKSHSTQFYKQQSGLLKKSAIIEDKS